MRRVATRQSILSHLQHILVTKFKSTHQSDIWDEPIAQESPKRINTIQNVEEEEEIVRRPAKRPRQTLFLADSDDDVELVSPNRAVQKAPPVQDVDIDALFADFDEDEDDSLVFKPLPPRIDEAELARQAEKRARNAMPSFTPHQILPSSSPQRDASNSFGKDRSDGKKGDDGKDGKKARPRPRKLDESRLLGSDGFPSLIKMTKNFRIKGKGHEATDLNRLLQQYQYWTHQLHPKTQFRETVERVEKLCHSRRMNVSLSVWRDEAHGRPSQQKDVSEEEDADLDHDNQDTGPPRSSSSCASSPQPGPSSEDNLPIRPETQPFDAPGDTHREVDEQEDFWRSLDEFSGDISDPPPAPTTVPNSSMDEDEDMWDIINEVEQAEQAASKAPANPPNATNVEPPDAQSEPDEDDWESMYL